MAGVFGEAVALTAARVGAIEVVVPAVPRLADTVKTAVASWRMPARVVTDPAEKDAAFRTARAALTKSGTSTLELAVAGIPMVAAYKVPLFEEAIARLFIKAPEHHPGQSGSGRKRRAGVPAAGFQARTACRRPDAAIDRYAGAAAAGSRPSPGSTASWRSARARPVTAPQPWCSIAPAPLTNRNAKQWYRGRQRRNLPH